MNLTGFGGDSSFNFTNVRPTGNQRNGGSPPNLTEEDVDDLKMELTKVEDEIQTLRQVLLAKEKYAVEIKSQLGMGPLSGLKQNLAKGWQDVQTSSPYLSASATLEDISQSNAYKRTRESLSHAGQVTTAALSSVGVAITRRLGEMRPSLNHSIGVPTMRTSSTFKSFEDMVGNVKGKMTGSRSNAGSTSGFDRSPSQDGPF